jgi:GSCFA family protein
MPAFTLSGLEAFQLMGRNPRSRWGSVVGEAAENGVGGPCFLPGLLPKFQIRKAEPAFAIGSCFAQEVQLALLKQGFRFASIVGDPPNRQFFMQEVTGSEPQFWPLHFFHRYNVPSMLQEIDRILDDAAPLNAGALLFTDENGRVCDYHYHHHFPLADIDQAMARRKFVRDQFQNLKNCRLMIITLGLTEAWLDNETGLYLNTTPNYRLVRDNPERFTFTVLNAAEVHNALSELIDKIRSFVADMKFIVTVSPIPLEGTFAPNDVVVSTNHSKATLITVAREIAYVNDDVDYFPSYEIVLMSSRAEVWTKDHRHVTPEFVQQIMRHFSDAYVV